MSSLSIRVPRLRSALFVPGHRRDFLDKVTRSGADGIIIDLEDSVPADMLDEARAQAGRWISAPPPGAPAICVRINGLARGCLDSDLEAVTARGLVAIMIPKIGGAHDVLEVERALSRLEDRRGLEAGSIGIWPMLETALAVHGSYAIASSSRRVCYMGVGGSANGDLAREIGCQFSESFMETLYIRSKVLLDARAASVPHPLAGMISEIRDMTLVESYARFVRGLGYEGLVTIHPAQVAVANAVFGPSPEEVSAAKRLIEALRQAEAEGKGAILHEGRMVDAAHLQSARKLLSEAEALAKRQQA